MTLTPIRSQSDLEETWRTLMAPLGFSRHSIWMMLIGPDDVPHPQLTTIDEAEAVPTGDELAGFAEFLHLLRAEVAPGARLAFLRSRPGGAGLTSEDRGWAHAIHEAGRMAEAPLEVVHRACDVDVVPVPLDELLVDTA